MTSPPRKPGFVLPIAVTLAALLGLYVGTYYAMSHPRSTGWPRGTFLVEPFYGTREYGQVPLPAEMEWHLRLFPFFAPIHWLDRRIRPHVWDATP
jgi:hypothetical protein